MWVRGRAGVEGGQSPIRTFYVSKWRSPFWEHKLWALDAWSPCVASSTSAPSSLSPSLHWLESLSLTSLSSLDGDESEITMHLGASTSSCCVICGGGAGLLARAYIVGNECISGSMELSAFMAFAATWTLTLSFTRVHAPSFYSFS